tara:strand:- start:2187 stop:2399 length:213 start_codon:yes stop_codon:yes gene_type:complete
MNKGVVSINLNVNTDVLHSLNEILKEVDCIPEKNTELKNHIQRLQLFIINAKNTFQGKPMVIESYEEWKV